MFLAKNIVLMNNASENRFDFDHDTKHNSSGKSSKLKRIFIFAVLFVIITIVFAMTFIFSNNRNDEEAKVILEIFTAHNAQDFLSKANSYKEIANSTTDSFNRSLSRALEAYMYYSYAVNSDRRQVFEEYLNRALITIHRKDINLKRGDWLYYFINSIEGICFTAFNNFFFIIDNWINKEQWARNIKELEFFVETNSVDWNNDYHVLAFRLSYCSLANYYLKLCLCDFQRIFADKLTEGHDLNLSEQYHLHEQKALMYQKLFTEFEQKNRNRFGIIPNIDYYIFLKNFYLSRALSIMKQVLIDSYNKDTLITEFNTLIEDCRNVLHSASLGSANESVYVYFNNVILRALIAKRTIYENDGVSSDKKVLEISQTMHEIVSNILKLQDLISEEALFIIFHSSLCMFQYCEFTDDDVNDYFNLELKIQNSNLYKDLPLTEKRLVQYYSCINCMSIIEKNGYKTKIYKLGLQRVQELKNYAAIIGTENIRNGIDLHELYSYFSESEYEEFDEGYYDSEENNGELTSEDKDE